MRLLIGSLLVGFALVGMAKMEDNAQALRTVSESTNLFSSSLFKTVVEENSGNLVMSPLSANIVLAMAACGAGGETEKQFKKVLHFPTPDSLAISGYQALIDTLNNVQQNKLLLANKVFAAERLTVKPTYKDLTETYFHSTTQLVNFAESEKAANTINTWVQQNTNNLIQDIVSPSDLGSLTAMVLVNAVYFKGQWKDKFDPENTRDITFYVNKNIEKQVPAMYRNGNYRYGDLPDLNARFIVLPYTGNELSMVIILPNEIDGLAEVERKLQNINLATILSQGTEGEVTLYLPKFKVESKIDLKNILEEMGLTNAFTRQANFSGIADVDLSISKVLQKAFIEVNEEGSKASAATGIILEGRCMSCRMEMEINHPFFYSIVKLFTNPETKATHVISLFSGHICEPIYA